MKRIAVYPGSFDPIHNGHLDLIERARPLFDELWVAVLRNESKQALFSVEERIGMLEELVGSGCQVASFSGLLVHFVEQVKGQTIIRGLRSVTDFDYEFQMVLMNRKLSPGVDTLFLMPRGKYLHLSSSLIKEVCALGGDVKGLLPPMVEERLVARLRG